MVFVNLLVDIGLPQYFKISVIKRAWFPDETLSNTYRNRNVSTKNNHSLGVSPPETNKQPRQSPAEESTDPPITNSDDEDGSGFKDDNVCVIFRCVYQNLHDLPEDSSIVKDQDIGSSALRTGLVIKPVRGDGACLFRAVADQIYGDEEMHDDVRRLCMDYMEKNSDHFSQFVTEDFHDYITRKRRRDAHGNHVELQAISEIFSRPIEIYEYCTEPRNISSSRLDASPSAEPNPPIRLSYHGAIHYNSVIDPTKATVGVGLGLPEYSPGAADRSLLQEAMQKSEVQLIEDAMLHDKIKMTDFERTEQDISEQIARQSYLDYLKSISKTEGAEVKGTYGVSEPGCSHTNIRPQENNDDTIVYVQEMNDWCDIAAITPIGGPRMFMLILEMFDLIGANEWFHAAGSDAEESALLAQVMALSQQEFLNSLKRNHRESRMMLIKLVLANLRRIR
ncbi:OTU domain-containing protein 5 [Dirofilaria immitis]|nr:OTU domain-containing protein 5 [Dirofilaria immitis]